MDITQRLRKYLHDHKISVPEFEKSTGIPKDRVYKWLQKSERGEQPRLTVEDHQLVTEYLENGYVSKLEEPKADYKVQQGSFAELLSKAMEVIASNQRIMEENAALLREQHGTIDKQTDLMSGQHRTIDNQQATIHVLATGHKKTGS